MTATVDALVYFLQNYLKNIYLSLILVYVCLKNKYEAIKIH